MIEAKELFIQWTATGLYARELLQLFTAQTALLFVTARHKQANGNQVQLTALKVKQLLTAIGTAKDVYALKECRIAGEQLPTVVTQLIEGLVGADAQLRLESNDPQTGTRARTLFKTLLSTVGCFVAQPRPAKE